MDKCDETQQIWKKARTAYFERMQRPPPPNWNELEYIRFFLASPQSCIFCGIVESTEVHWQFHKDGINVQFWQKDIDANFRKYGLKSVKAYDDEEGKKMLEVQKKFMEECEDRNKTLRN
ncbi:9263_t:CDS:2 [Entrophospora sp. SA101]|nr:9263_t:CDS:2 [Entrophospora sp. SA101]